MPFGAFCPLPLRLGGSAEEGWSPEQHARFCADLWACKRVAPLASWSFSVTVSTATILTYVGQNGSGLAYAPTATRNGNGDASFVWSSQYFADEYGTQHPWKIRACIVTGDAAGAAMAPAWERIANGIRIRLKSHSGAALNGTGNVRLW